MDFRVYERLQGGDGALSLVGLGYVGLPIAVAMGARKAEAIQAYMRNAPHQTWLITDEAASNLILNGKTRLK